MKHEAINFLFDTELSVLLKEATKIRELNWGKTISYSRKVFIPLTNMCRNTCSYCTFVKPPESEEASILTKEEVLKIIKEGEKQGCKEALFSLGEKPELRYPIAKLGLRKLGFNSMPDYLKAVCKMTLEESTLLPHINAGTLSVNDIAKLKPVTASMGMMLETTSKRLTKKGQPHYACPDKVPIQRIRTLINAGKMKVPFTTGLLIGIGETFSERIEALETINNIHKQYGHIQEVIIQNFQRKPDIAMRNAPEPSSSDMLRTIAAARIVLDPEISIQAPPNLSNSHLSYLSAGINDWGGISPVTIDFINPQHSWPHLDELKKGTEKYGCELKERLTIYKKFLTQKSYVDDTLKDHISLLADKNGLASNQCLENQ
jgi:FO synthase